MIRGGGAHRMYSSKERALSAEQGTIGRRWKFSSHRAAQAKASKLVCVFLSPVGAAVDGEDNFTAGPVAGGDAGGAPRQAERVQRRGHRGQGHRCRSSRVRRW